MAKLSGIVRDTKGNIITGATVSVYDQGTVNLSTVYDDAALSIVGSNPLTSDADGKYSCYVPEGYYKIVALKSGFGQFSEDDIFFADPAHVILSTQASALVAMSSDVGGIVIPEMEGVDHYQMVAGKFASIHKTATYVSSLTVTIELYDSAGVLKASDATVIGVPVILNSYDLTLTNIIAENLEAGDIIVCRVSIAIYGATFTFLCEREAA